MRVSSGLLSHTLNLMHPVATYILQLDFRRVARVTDKSLFGLPAVDIAHAPVISGPLATKNEKLRDTSAA